MKTIACCAAVASMAAMVYAQTQIQSPPVIYEGARLIIGDGSAAIESGVFVVRNGHITAIGNPRAVTAPAGATRVNLAGKTVMPAMINVHVHIGYEGYTSW